MIDELSRLVTAGGYLPNVNCIDWPPPLLWTYVVADVLIFLSYAAMPLALGLLARRRQDFPYPCLLWMFAAFIMACGLSHLMGAIVLWLPLYGVDALLKALTALVSVATAAMFWSLLPHALKLPGPTQLARENEILRDEIAERKLAEDALRTAKDTLEGKLGERIAEFRASEERYRTLVENIPDLIVRYDAELRRIYVNPAWEEASGLSAEEVLGVPAAEILKVPKATDDEYRAKLRKVLENGTPQAMTFSWVNARGATLYLEYVMVPEHDRHGTVVSALAVGHDVTERKLAEARINELNADLERKVGERTAELEESNARIADLYNHAPCGYLSLDANDTIVAINDTALEMLGCRRDEVVGRRRIPEMMAPGSLSWFEGATELSGGRQVHNAECKFVRKNGSILPVLISAEMQRDSDGKLLFSRATIMDNSDRLKVVQVLQLHTNILANIAEGVCLIDPATAKILFLNRRFEEMLGYAHDELIGQPISSINVGDVRLWRKTLQDIQNGLARMGTWRGETLKRRSNGTIFWTSTAITTLEHPDYGKVWVSIEKDITEQKQRQEKLQLSHDELEHLIAERTEQLRRLTVEATLAEERERKAVARDLHDDLGQVLHVAKIKLEALAREESTPSGKRLASELDGLVGDASRMLRSLTAQLSPPVLSSLGLVPALFWLADEMQRTYGLKVGVVADDAAKPLTEAQSAILFRAVRELLINVAKHAGVGEARVDVSADGSQLFIIVEDNGRGLDPGAKATDGFGLVSVRERITFLGGDLEVQRGAEGGTVVSLWIPLESDRGTTTEVRS